MKVRSGALKQAAAELQRQRLLLDVADSALEVYKVTEEHFSMAERLVARVQFSISSPDSRCHSACRRPRPTGGGDLAG